MDKFKTGLIYMGRQSFLEKLSDVTQKDDMCNKDIIN